MELAQNQAKAEAYKKSVADEQEHV
jgi:hypothetical protein